MNKQLWENLRDLFLHCIVCRIHYAMYSHFAFNAIHLPSTNGASQMINISESYFWVFSLFNHVALFGLASPRLVYSLIGHIKTPHSFKNGCNNIRWVVLYTLISQRWPHSWLCRRVRTILFPKQGCVRVLLSWTVRFNQFDCATVLEERVRTAVTWIAQDGVVLRTPQQQTGAWCEKKLLCYFADTLWSDSMVQICAKWLV